MSIPTPILARRSLFVLLLVSCSWQVQAQPPPPTSEAQAKEREIVTLGLAAKLLASAVFISGRDPASVMEEDFKTGLYAGHDWSTTRIDVDREAGRVTLSTPGAGERVAVFTGPDAQGVVLMPVGEMSLRFTPRAIPRKVGSADAAWPSGDRIDPAARPAGIDEAALRKAVAAAFEGSEEADRQRTRALLVVRNGQLVAERYAPGFNKDQPLIGWSMGKTIAATLLGLVVDWEPKLDVQAPAPIAQWQAPNDPRARITVAQLLNMSSGLDCPSPGFGSPDYATPRNVHNSPYYGIVNAHETMLSRPLQEPPGSRWLYRNVNTFALAEIVRERVYKRGLDYLSFPQSALFDRIGARSFVLETDLVGNFLITGFDYATARDWARFGEFLRRDGVAFDGTRLLPEGWVDFLRKPAPVLKAPYYGGQVWLNADGAFPSLPRDLYYARGAMEQLVIVIPSLEMVVVRLGHTPDEETMMALYPHLDKIIADVVSALSASGGARAAAS
jgi:CubicO group peptidase (beta-lactamase class C family)